MAARAALIAFLVKERLMKTDAQLQADVAAELAWDPAINASAIGVIVKNGVVTLTGHLDTFAQKHAAERAVRRVAGVRGIAVELDVRLAPEHQRSDSDIAQAAIAALRWNSLVPDDRVKVEVEDGWVTLSGEVDWPYQFSSAEQCIRPLTGVRGVTNGVKIKPRLHGKDIADQITAALTRHAEREARHVTVTVDGGTVTLSGAVDSLAEHDAAIGAAFGTRGVTSVVDKLEVKVA
jgi:osmotically-inducible protein OsmY